jgi:hypothetical protein
MRLSDEELREVLTRAEEIQRTSRHGSAWEAEQAAVISAGEELGLSRQAIELALTERFQASPAPPEVGDLVWARSADDKFHVAEVRRLTDRGAVVQFLRGSEHRVMLEEMRPCALVPGLKIVCEWPWWGPYTGTVLSYDAVKQKVKVSDGFSTKAFPISEISLALPKPKPVRDRNRIYAGLLVAGATAGALIGSLLTAWLLP